MALNKIELKASIRKAFEDASKAVEEDPEADSLEILTTKLSNAIDTFVRDADVVDVVVEVEDDPATGKLTGTQVGTGKVQ